MNADVIVEQLTRQPFAPFTLVTANGRRYAVRDPRFVKVTQRHVYWFCPIGHGPLASDPDILGLCNITATEPLV